MGRINDCPLCLEKQREIDRLKEENGLLRQRLSYRQRKDKEGFFGSSTPSSQQPLKANTEEVKKPRGAKIGHKGFGRKGFSVSQADRVEHVEAMEYSQAHTLSACMLLFSFVVLFGVYATNRRFPIHLS